MDIAILGSCVTRDTFTRMAPLGANLATYVGRQSIISIGHPVTDQSLLSKKLDSPFRQRMFQGDLQGNGLTQIARAYVKNPDTVLIIDLTDERGGYFMHPDGQIATRGYEADSARCFDHLDAPWQYVKFGSTPHMLAFLDAANTLKQELKALGAWEKTLVFDSRWAPRDHDGNQTPPSYLLTADTANEYLAEYTLLLRDTGWQVVDSPIAPVADPSNIWGFAPFHYHDDYYQANAKHLMTLGKTILRASQSCSHSAD